MTPISYPNGQGMLITHDAHEALAVLKKMNGKALPDGGIEDHAPATKAFASNRAREANL